MPKVPVSNNVVPMRAPNGSPVDQPTDAQLMMSAAMMHQEGRLFAFPDAAKYSAEVKATQKKLSPE